MTYHAIGIVQHDASDGLGRVWAVNIGSTYITPEAARKMADELLAAAADVDARSAPGPVEHLGTTPEFTDYAWQSGRLRYEYRDGEWQFRGHAGNWRNSSENDWEILQKTRFPLHNGPFTRVERIRGNK